MNAGFIKFLRSEVAEELMRYPTSFTLLAQIAFRARREVPKINPFHMEVGEAMIGDYASIGLSRQQYRLALENLCEWGYVTTRATNKGTVAKLCNSEVYDINCEIGQPTNEPPREPAKEPRNNHPGNQPRNHETTTNKNDKKEEEKKPTSLRSVAGKEVDELFTSFWLAYPRKDAKKNAQRAFSKLALEDREAAAQRVRDWFGRRTDWIGTDGTDYRPHAASWLNQARWIELAEISIIQPPQPHATPYTNPTTRNGFALVDDAKRKASFDLLAAIGL